MPSFLFLWYTTFVANRTYQLQVQNFGPVKEAQVEFSDMTVFVGLQATGKSLVLQLFKLLLDRDRNGFYPLPKISSIFARR